jgi:hypothetical protein
MGTILASTSRADGAADTTTAAFAFSADDVITVSCANSATAPPSNPPQVTLQLSTDNVNWTAVDRRWFGVAPGITYYQAFELARYLQGSQSSWSYFRLVIGGNIGGAVTVAASDGDPKNLAIVPLTATTATTGGAVGTWKAPGATRVIITRVVLDITTKSTGAANLSVGTATDGVTSSANLIDTLAVGSAAGTFDNIVNGGTNGKAMQPLASGSSVTVTGSATTAGLVGTMYIEYIKP